MKKFKDYINESNNVSVKANGTTYELKVQLNKKGNKYDGDTYNIIAKPKNKTDIIVFKDCLYYVGEPGEWYLAKLGYTDGYDNGHDLPKQSKPSLSYEERFISSEILPALEGKNREYTDITYELPYNTKLSDIKQKIF